MGRRNSSFAVQFSRYSQQTNKFSSAMSPSVLALCVVLCLATNTTGSERPVYVSFDAFCWKSVTVQAYQDLKCEQVITNRGGGYNSSTGVFTAPVAGKYTFLVHVRGQKDKRVNVALYHNDKYVTKASDDGKDFEAGKTSADLHLQQGDKVVVRAMASELYIMGWFWTGFAGTLRLQ